MRSTTPFDIEYERGVLFGGTSAPGDMRYVKVSAERTSIRDKTYTIEFRRCQSLALAQRVAQPDRPVAAGKADPIAVTASLGVAALTPDDTVQSLIGAADAMLYAAKHAARNRVIGPTG